MKRRYLHTVHHNFLLRYYYHCPRSDGSVVFPLSFFNTRTAALSLMKAQSWGGAGISTTTAAFFGIGMCCQNVSTDCTIR